MDPALVARAAVLGFTIAAAVGPISLLTIRRTLAHGRAYGLASGLGVALADGTYAAIAAFGLTALTAVLVGARTVLGLGGGVVLLWLAIATLRSRPALAAEAGTGRPGLLPALVSIYALTMANPMTILSFAALFGALGFPEGSAAGGVGSVGGGVGSVGGGMAMAAVALTVGVFLGSALWWLVLTTGVGWLRERVTLRVLRWVNRASGAVLLVFAVAAIVGTVATAADAKP